MTDDQPPKPTMNEILRGLRGIPHTEPTEPLSNADLNRALRAGFGRADAPVEQHEAPAGQAPADPPGPDFGGGSRGTSPVPSEPTPDMNTLLRSARPSRDAFGGINDVVKHLYGNEED